MEVSGQLHAPAALPQGKSIWYPLDRRLGGPQSRSGRRCKEKKNPFILARSLASILTITPDSAMDRTCSMYGAEKECIQNSGFETSSEKAGIAQSV
jgi:hypothetical protein